MPLAFNYDKSKSYCQQIGLVWFGDEYAGLVAADAEAKAMGLTQDQVDATMRLHIREVRELFEPRNYKFLQRLVIAFYFLSGWKPS